MLWVGLYAPRTPGLRAVAIGELSVSHLALSHGKLCCVQIERIVGLAVADYRGVVDRDVTVVSGPPRRSPDRGEPCLAVHRDLSARHGGSPAL
jgi:hypothetical protein